MFANRQTADVLVISPFSDYPPLSKSSIFVFSELQPYYPRNNILKGTKYSFCIISVADMYSKCNAQKVTLFIHCKWLDIKSYFFPFRNIFIYYIKILANFSCYDMMFKVTFFFSLIGLHKSYNNLM